MSATKQIIIGGSYASSNSGNFTAKTAKGEEIFVSKAVLAQAGVQAGAIPTFPMFGFSINREIGTRDPQDPSKFLMEADGVTQKVTKRHELSALFQTAEAFSAVENAEYQLGLTISTMRKQMLTTSGLTQEDLTAIASVSF